MAGTVDYAALPIICEILGIQDIEQAIRLMQLILQAEKQLPVGT